VEEAWELAVVSGASFSPSLPGLSRQSIPNLQHRMDYRHKGGNDGGGWKKLGKLPLQ